MPALYDGFREYQSYLFSPEAPVIAEKDGKCGIVKGDGSGQQLSEFKYDYIQSLPFCTLYAARWDGVKERFGIIAATGEVLCPNVLTSIGEVFNGIMTINSENKCGVIDVDSYQCVLPEYDDLEMDAEADEDYIDVPVLATRLF